jgi:hypothetical protein
MEILGLFIFSGFVGVCDRVRRERRAERQPGKR